MDSGNYFLEKAAQYRRLALDLRHDERTAVSLLALAVEFEARAVAIIATEMTEKQFSLLPSNSGADEEDAPRRIH
jgi:hypothetical protein